MRLGTSGLTSPAAWLSALKKTVRKTQDGQRNARRTLERVIERQARDGILEPREAEEAKRGLNSPETARAVKHLGAHMAMSIPLRFPAGSIARFLWTVVCRLKVEVMARRGQVTSRELIIGRRVHSVRVATLAAVPGLGAFAYIAAAPIRRHRVLLAALLDEAARRIPAGLYESQHLAVLTEWAKGRRANNATAASTPARRTRWPLALSLLGGVLALNLAALIAADDPATEDILTVERFRWAQLLLAGVFGIVAFNRFWRLPGAADRPDAVLNFFWLLAGIGAVFLGFDDFVELHEAPAAIADELLGDILRDFDILVLAGYGLAALVLVAVFYRGLVRYDPVSLLFVLIAVALSLLALVYNAPSGDRAATELDDVASLLAAGAVLAAFTNRLVTLELAVPGRRRNRPGGTARRERHADAGGMVR